MGDGWVVMWGSFSTTAYLSICKRVAVWDLKSHIFFQLLMNKSIQKYSGVCEYIGPTQAYNVNINLGQSTVIPSCAALMSTFKLIGWSLKNVLNFPMETISPVTTDRER